MDIGSVTQITGWTASVLAILSYSLRDVREIRIANCCAAAFFIVYGALMGAPAIVAMNATLALVHIAYLLTDGSFKRLIESHPRASMSAFGAYAAASIFWVALSTGMDFVEIVGIVSSVAFVGGFLLPREASMRVTCSVALAMNIAYAFLIASPQIALTNSVSLVVNIVRLIQRHRTISLLKNSGIETTD